MFTWGSNDIISQKACRTVAPQETGKYGPLSYSSIHTKNVIPIFFVQKKFWKIVYEYCSGKVLVPKNLMQLTFVIFLYISIYRLRSFSVDSIILQEYLIPRIHRFASNP